MQVFRTTKEIQEFILNYKSNNKDAVIGFVPTMGALHSGHLSLIKKSVESCDLTIVSIFVNPTQFGVNEDFDKYPRDEIADLNLCESLGVVVFIPEVNQLYCLDSDSQIKIKAPLCMSNVFEGSIRIGHFDGVLQVVLKLFNIITPNKAFFGKKDAQQLLIIQQMVYDLFLPIEIVPCDIIRDDKGLALSSRNVYLNNQAKNEALRISKSLREASKVIASGVRDSKSIKKVARDILEGLNIEYIAVVNKHLQELEEIEVGNTIILVAVKIDGVRLLDNLWL